FFVEERVWTLRSIDDEVNALAFDEIDDIWAAFFHFVHALARHTRTFDHVGSPGCGHQLESHVDEFPRDLRHLRLIVIGDADEDHPLYGHALSGCGLGLGKGFPEVVGHAHDFAGRFHLRTEHTVHAGTFVPGHARRLHVVGRPSSET